MNARRVVWILAAWALLLVACRFTGQGAQAPASAITIQEVAPLNGQLYYGQTACGPTTLVATVKVQGPAKNAGLRYRYVGTQASEWFQAWGMPTQPGVYQVAVPLDANKAQQVAATHVEYQAVAVDGQGKQTTAPQPGQIPVQACQQAGASGTDTAAPTIHHVSTSQTPLFYQSDRCGPTALRVQALVTDNSGQARVSLEYQLGSQAPQRMPMQAQGTLYTADVSVAQAGQVLQGKAGQLRYRVIAQDAAGNTSTYPAGNTFASVPVQPCRQQAAAPAQGNNRPAAPANPGNNRPSAPKPPQAPSGASNNPAGSGGAQPPSNSGAGNAKPPTVPPAQGAASLTITDVRANPDEVYYGVCAQGETTWVDIEVVVDDIQRVQEARLHYRYESATQAGSQGFPYSVPMYRAQGIGNYTARVEFNDDLTPSDAVDWMVYYVEIRTTDGQTVQSPTYFHPLGFCNGTGNPPAPPPVDILNVQVYPDTVFYGLCSSGEPTSVYFAVEVQNPDRVAHARVVYSLTTLNGDPEWNHEQPLTRAQDVFEGTIDVASQVGLMDAIDTLFYVVEVTDDAGNEIYYGPDMVPVRACTPRPLLQILYFESLNANNQAHPGAPVLLRWETEGANCGVYLNGNPVNEDEPQEYLATYAGDAGSSITFTLEAMGGDCSMPQVVSETVTITVVAAPDSGDAGGVNYRVSNMEEVAVYAGYDLDTDGVADLYFDWVGDDLLATAMNGAQVGPLDRLQGSYSETIALCEALLPMTGSATLSVRSGDMFCVQTSAGRYGYIIIDDIRYESTMANAVFYLSVASQTP